MSQAGAPMDTALEAHALQVELYRRMSPAQKLHRVTDLTLAAAQYALAGLAERYPAADRRELLLHLARMRLGEDAFLQAYGPPSPPHGA
jgi:hypothetical protein